MGSIEARGVVGEPMNHWQEAQWYPFSLLGFCFPLNSWPRKKGPFIVTGLLEYPVGDASQARAAYLPGSRSLMHPSTAVVYLLVSPYKL